MKNFLLVMGGLALLLCLSNDIRKEKKDTFTIADIVIFAEKPEETRIIHPKNQKNKREFAKKQNTFPKKNLQMWFIYKQATYQKKT